MVQADSLRGANVASVDANLAHRIASFSDAGKLFALDTRTARSTRLADFKTDDSFILLGSPRSNPWDELFRDELIAGSSAEATEAAGNLATNPELFQRKLAKEGISSHGKPREFGVLMRVSTTAGSPNTFKVIACHVFPDKAA